MRPRSRRQSRSWWDRGKATASIHNHGVIQSEPDGWRLFILLRLASERRWFSPRPSHSRIAVLLLLRVLPTSYGETCIPQLWFSYYSGSNENTGTNERLSSLSPLIDRRGRGR